VHTLAWLAWLHADRNLGMSFLCHGLSRCEPQRRSLRSAHRNSTRDGARAGVKSRARDEVENRTLTPASCPTFIPSSGRVALICWMSCWRTEPAWYASVASMPRPASTLFGPQTLYKTSCDGEKRALAMRMGF